MILVFVSLALMTMDHRQHYFNRLHTALSAIVAPIQYVVDWPVNRIKWILDSVSTHQILVQDNAQLRAHQLLLEAKMQRLLMLENENSSLRRLLMSTPHVSGRVLAAEILAVDLDPFVHQVILSVGRDEGVYEGQPVVDAYGIMGQVIQVGPTTSRVLLLSDTRSAIPVQANRNNIRLIAVGSGASNTLSLQHVTDTTDIKVGDVLLSSGLGQRYPVGYPVGVVTRIDRDPTQSFVTAELAPSAHLTRSREVLLVWPNRAPKQVETKSPPKVKQGKPT